MRKVSKHFGKSPAFLIEWTPFPLKAWLRERKTGRFRILEKTLAFIYGCIILFHLIIENPPEYEHPKTFETGTNLLR